MNFLSLFVLIPVLMLGGLLLASDIKQIRAVCATGASLLLLLAVALTVLFLGERNSGNTAEMIFTASSVWYVRPCCSSGYWVSISIRERQA